MKSWNPNDPIESWTCEVCHDQFDRRIWSEEDEKSYHQNVGNFGVDEKPVP
jgi:hypothetical protein